MLFTVGRVAFIAVAAAIVAATPIVDEEATVRAPDLFFLSGRGFNRNRRQLAKREVSYGNPDLVTDQGNRFKLNFGSPDGHPNACPGHYICCEPI